MVLWFLKLIFVGGRGRSEKIFQNGRIFEISDFSRFSVGGK